MRNQEYPKFSKGWLYFFFLTIGLVGSLFGYLSALPLFYLGRLWNAAGDLGGRTLAYGVEILLSIQPWLDADIEIDLPKFASRRAKPYVTLSNHRSHLDMFILLSRIPSIRVLAKAPLFRVPFLSLMLRAMRDVPVIQGDLNSYLTGITRLKEGLKFGDAVHLFPEMTRCDPGYPKTGRFHLPIINMVREAGYPIYPIVFINTDDVWPKGTFGVSYKKKTIVRSLPPIQPRDFNSTVSLTRHLQSQMDAVIAGERQKLNVDLRQTTNGNSNVSVHSHV